MIEQPGGTNPLTSPPLLTAPVSLEDGEVGGETLNMAGDSDLVTTPDITSNYEPLRMLVPPSHVDTNMDIIGEPRAIPPSSFNPPRDLVWELDEENNPIRTFELENNLEAAPDLEASKLPEEREHVLRLLSRNSYHPKEAHKFLLCATYNCCKSANNVASFLEAYSHLDVIFVQEIPIYLIRHLPSPLTKEGVPLYDAPLHYNWTCIQSKHEKRRVATYVNKRRASMFPKIRTDIIDHPDMICVSLSLTDGSEAYFLNVYNDADSSALTHLSETVDRLPPLHCMAGDFNIHDPMWDSRTLSNSARADCLMDISQRLSLTLWQDDMQTATRIPFNKKDREAVLDLVFANLEFQTQFNYTPIVEQGGRFLSDHCPVLWAFRTSIPARPARPILPVKAHEAFIEDLCSSIDKLGLIGPFGGQMEVTWAGEKLTKFISDTYDKHVKFSKPTYHQREWWDHNCHTAYMAYLSNTSNSALKKAYIQATRKAKRRHFDNVIQQSSKTNKLWDLVNWMGPRALPTYHALKNKQGQSFSSVEETMAGFADQFCKAEERPVYPEIFDQVDFPTAPMRPFQRFSNQELMEALATTPSASAPGPDHFTWPMFKEVLQNSDKFRTLILNLYNGMLDYGICLSFVKESHTVIIPKPHKPDYSALKAYRPIALYSTLGKLLEKMIAKRMQFQAQCNLMMHPMQFGGTMHHSTIDAGICLVSAIRKGWRLKLHTSILALDVEQFYPSVNHHMLLTTLNKFGFHTKLTTFLGDYLKGRSTTLGYAGATSQSFEMKVGLGQGSSLSPVLANLYIAPVVRMVDMFLPKSADIQFYVDDGTIRISSESLEVNCQVLAAAYKFIDHKLSQLGLAIGHDKTELIHFPIPQSEEGFIRPGGPTAKHTIRNDLPGVFLHDGPYLHKELRPITTQWRYLGLWLDPSLKFQYHVKFYANRAFSLGTCLRLLGNSSRGLNPVYKRRLYLSNIFPIMTYGCQM